MKPIASVPYKLPRATYERYVAMRWLRRRWWVLVAPMAAAAAVSVALADVRWLIVALLYLFIVLPAILSMAYFRYLLNPGARITALLKRVVILPGSSIKIEYIRRKDDEWVPSDELIRWGQVEKTEWWGTNYVFELKGEGWPRFLIVPRKALPSPLPAGCL